VRQLRVAPFVRLLIRLQGCVLVHGRAAVLQRARPPLACANDSRLTSPQRLDDTKKPRETVNLDKKPVFDQGEHPIFLLEE